MSNRAAPSRPWAERWDADDPGFWARGGRYVARRNLLLAALCGHLGLSVRGMWPVIVLFLPAGSGAAPGPGEKFLLLVTPVVAGAALRPAAARALARLGGRDHTAVTTAALALPGLAAVYALQRPGAPLWLLLAAAATAGAGDAAAASPAGAAASFPRHGRARALALATVGGDLGLASAQLVGLLAATTAGGSSPARIAAVHIPLTLLAALVVALRMDNLPGEVGVEVTEAEARSWAGAGTGAGTDPHLAWLSLLSLATAGSFTGYGLAFGLVLRHGFGASALVALACALPATLLGAAARPCGGWLAGRWGGARVTLGSLTGMAVGTAVLAAASSRGVVGVFAAAFTVLIVLGGIGAGAVATVAPAVFAARAGEAILSGQDARTAFAAARRRTVFASGLTGPAGALGAAAIGLSLGAAYDAGSPAPALWGLLGLYALCAVVTWAVYARRETVPEARLLRHPGRGPAIPDGLG
ncbi:MFS transporter [Streptomyces hiroshimensis]|uniref:MFS transporter n=1 Tax=Streptomyces hiroshimensis TaxID=66424 RepID=A0ABQ2Y313_9ACTN|nr:MFS transporter [Streptomyces hiroshimensis]GGX60495.1 MFS transporter [Streptomyces hiroshimensis]